MSDNGKIKSESQRNGSSAQEVLDQIIAEARSRERSSFSQKTYADEPILRTGADFKRSFEQKRLNRQAGRDPAQNGDSVAERDSDDQPSPLERTRETRKAPKLPANPAASHDGSTRRVPESTQLTAKHSTQRATEATRPAAKQLDLSVDLRTGQPNTTTASSAEAQSEPIEHRDSPLERMRARERERAAASHADLPPVLQELRALEQPTRSWAGGWQSTAELFVQQAHIAEGFADEAPYLGIVPYHRVAAYASLSDAELRGYFTWRTQWAAGNVGRIPNAFARIRAAEIANNVGVGDAEAGLRELQRLRARSAELDKDGMGAAINADLARWTRDYAVVHGLDAGSLASEDERSFAYAVAVLHLAEKTTVATGYRPQPPQPPKAAANAPTDRDVWQALQRIAAYRANKSPFLRTHEAQAAAVAAVVFERLANWCALHSSMTLTEALVGRGSHSLFTPFLGLPYIPDEPHPDAQVRLTAASVAVCKHGRWRIRRGYGSMMPSKQLDAMLHAMDRHMRADWEFGHPLKPRPLEPALDRLIAEASAEMHAREAQQAAAAEAEKRRMTFDLAKLGGIRADAAVTREALLVDEEVEDTPLPAKMPEPDIAAAAPAVRIVSSTAAPAAGTGAPAASEKSGAAVRVQGAAVSNLTDVVPAAPAPVAPAASSQPDKPDARQPREASNPCGLSDVELAVLEHIVAGTLYDDLLEAGGPMESVLIDGINEKLFDEVGDAVLEYDGNRAVLIEDYREDVQTILRGTGDGGLFRPAI